MSFGGIMNGNKLMNYAGRFGLAAALIVLACALQRQRVLAQPPAAARQASQAARQASQAAAGQASQAAAGQASEDEQFFRGIYQEFYDTYRLGPADEIAIRVTGQPDYTLEKVKVSPTGSVYHPLLRDVEVAGMTIP